MKLLSYFDTKPKPAPLTAAEFARLRARTGLQAATDRRDSLLAIKSRIEDELADLAPVIDALETAVENMVATELEPALSED